MLKKEEIDKLYDYLNNLNEDASDPGGSDDLCMCVGEYQDLCDKLIAMLYKAESEQSK